MNKLIFFTASLGLGGAERVISVLSNNLVDNFDEVEIVLFYDRPIFYSIDKRVKIISIESKTKSQNVFKNIKYLRSYLKISNPSVFVSFMAPFNIIALLSLPIQRTFPVIISDRSDPRFDLKSAFRRLLRKILYALFADHLVLQTENNKQYYPKIVRNKSSVIYNPISIKDSQIGIALNENKEKVIVSVGRFHPAKNHFLLINSYNRILQKYPEYKLIIYGDGDLRPQLESYIQQLGLERKVLLPGNVNNIPDTIKPAEIFVLSSDYEGMSNSLIEAMCLGLPVVSTKVNGAVDLIKDKVNGLLVDCGNEPQMISAIESLIENENLRNVISHNAVNIANDLNEKKIVSYWIELIKSVRSVSVR